MDCNPGAGDRINSFALVSYIPDPLGSFLDRLRQELVSSCFAKSHVTILPPRSLAVSQQEAERQLTEYLRDSTPFRLELAGIETFGATGVIYLAVGAGTADLKRMHEYLNRGVLSFEELHSYHPHVTLAQDFPPQELEEMERLAKERWASFKAARSFDVDRLTFVQNTTTNQWLDLAEYPLENSVLAT
jgi:2'-5' RNA ligase